MLKTASRRGFWSNESAWHAKPKQKVGTCHDLQKFVLTDFTYGGADIYEALDASDVRVPNRHATDRSAILVHFENDNVLTMLSLLQDGYSYILPNW